MKLGIVTCADISCISLMEGETGGFVFFDVENNLKFGGKG